MLTIYQTDEGNNCEVIGTADSTLAAARRIEAVRDENPAARYWRFEAVIDDGDGTIAIAYPPKRRRKARKARSPVGIAAAGAPASPFAMLA